ncbi:hypothetical protein P43SY_004277 [Pythium insidiosum]|uniref:Zinc finger PHD-type domain-containing protein n=1 Tax=Pythium insidiosum TaxID=114742 RepID=A0AAD5LU10_PYTIN|nr:hypothetical protein P43SY_004277 [Pythium insidiosum]
MTSAGSASTSTGSGATTHRQSRLSLNGAAGPVDEASRKRKATPRRAAATQKNTLDSWFGRAASAPRLKDAGAEAGAEAEVDAEAGAEGGSAAARDGRRSPRSKTARSPSKKLVQRRILLSDLCRVCESAKTDEATRCELKCVDCEMTVHRSCYGVDADGKNDGTEWEEDDDGAEQEEEGEGNGPTTPEKWRCRPCHSEWTQQQQQQQQAPAAHGDVEHAVCGASGAFAGVYNDSDFAAIYLFFKRFRRLGLRVNAEVTLSSLALALLSPENHSLLPELHVRLLQNVGVTLSKAHNWLVQVVKFLRSREDEFEAAKALFDALAAPSGDQDAWLSAYHASHVHDRIVILKALCEVQFDENDALIAKIGEQDDSEALRDGPIGVDSRKRSYYALEDAPGATDGGTWLCRCDQQNGAAWETVADGLSGLRSFLRALAFSRETADLQMWQTLRDGVYKSLERREKKRRLQAQRLARMPRLLGKTGLDVASTMAFRDESEPVIGRRSLRTRRAVNYRGLVGDDEDEEEEEEEEEEDAGDESDDDDDDGDDDEEEETSGSPRKRQRVEPPRAPPTRTSSRLRGHAPAPADAKLTSSSEEEEEDDEDDNSRPQRPSRRRLVRRAGSSDDDEEEQEEEEEAEEEE